MKRITLGLLLLLALVTTAVGQKAKRLQPGKLYREGDTLYTPHYGFKAVVPKGWEGQLPRDVEVFMLSSITGQGQIYVFGREKGSIEGYKKSWEEGMNLSETIRIRSGSNVLVEGDMLESDVAVDGTNVNKAMKGYAVTRCGPYGPCITGLGITSAPSIDALKKTMHDLFRQAILLEPSNVSPYADFDWKEFLSGKMMMSYLVVEGASRDTQVNLCADGSFMADIRKKGLMRDMNPAYKGKLKGTWSVDGIGEQTKLTLKFERTLPDLKVNLSIKDEKVFVEGERYFVSYSEYCNK